MTLSQKCCFYGAILITISVGIVAHNFDTDNVIVYEDAAGSRSDRGSYFGFSVALWNPGGGVGFEQSYVFIGAPRANTTTYNRVNEPGTVFQCKIGKQCKEWSMDTQDYKGPGAGAWLGGSMEIQNIQNGQIGKIVVCAPRWLDQHPNIESKRPTAWPMKGICYQADVKHSSELVLRKGAPLAPFHSSIINQLSYYVMGECGFSVHIVPDTNPSTIMGCPGLMYAHGTPIKYSFRNGDFSIPNVRVIIDVDDYMYTGYQVTSGYYFGHRDKRYYATSAPRGVNLYGTVTIFSFAALNNNPVSEIGSPKRGEQVGEYFGSALATCDIDGDGSDDLIVGAPQWTNVLDEGRIYYYTRELKNPQTYLGRVPRGRFGSAITCLGDIDYDGNDDVAVGAPYEGNGVVYIFRGSKDGLILTQTLSSPKDVKGFGISISQPVDIDNNDHVDIAVGAYLSGHVTLFRSKRAVSTYLTLSAVTGSTENTLDIKATSFLIQICSSYNGKHAPKELNVIKELKVDENLMRAEVEDAGQNQRTYTFPDTLKLELEPRCRNFTIKIKDKISNFLEPMKISVSQRLDTTNQTGTLWVSKNGTRGQEYFDSSSAVMNETHGLATAHVEVPFAVMCEDNVCNSNLSIQLWTSLSRDNPYVFGSKEHVELNIRVENSADPAYNAKARVIIPMPVQLNHIPSDCIREPISGSIQVICRIGNPLDTGETKELTLSLDMSRVTIDTTEIYINATATTQSNNSASTNHTNILSIYLTARTDIGIARKVSNDQYPYSLAEKDEKLPNIAFQHIYEIQNYEKTPIDQALLSVSIPTHWINGDNRIEIIRLNKTTTYLYGQEFSCADAKTQPNVRSLSYDATTMTEWWTGTSGSLRSDSMRDNKFTMIGNKIFSTSPDNRTLHINCTNPSVECKTINCQLVFGNSELPVAKLALLLELLLSNFSAEIIQDKDIIFFATNSSVEIQGPPGETVNNQPNLIMVGTKFIGLPPDDRVPIWIIILSIFVGLLLLVLLIFGLFKFGFFKRNKQMKLQALLKEKNEVKPEGVGEASTSACENM